MQTAADAFASPRAAGAADAPPLLPLDGVVAAAAEVSPTSGGVGPSRKSSAVTVATERASVGRRSVAASFAGASSVDGGSGSDGEPGGGRRASQAASAALVGVDEARKLPVYARMVAEDEGIVRSLAFEEKQGRFAKLYKSLFHADVGEDEGGGVGPVQ